MEINKKKILFTVGAQVLLVRVHFTKRNGIGVIMNVERGGEENKTKNIKLTKKQHTNRMCIVHFMCANRTHVYTANCSTIFNENSF